jgi:hypothetical protein
MKVYTVCKLQGQLVIDVFVPNDHPTIKYGDTLICDGAEYRIEDIDKPHNGSWSKIIDVWHTFMLYPINHNFSPKEGDGVEIKCKSS